MATSETSTDDYETDQPLDELPDDIDTFSELASSIDDDEDEAELPPGPSRHSESDVPRADFRVRNPLASIDSRSIATALVTVSSLAVLGGLVWLVKRLRGGHKRRSFDGAVLWHSGEEPPKVQLADLSRPLLGCGLAVAENYPVKGHKPSLHQVEVDEPADSNNSLIQTLLDAGATLTCAVRLDPLGVTGPFSCHSCAKVGNPGHPGRMLMGSAGALAAAVAAGKADLGVAADAGGDVLLPAACSGLSAFRCSQDWSGGGSVPLQATTSTSATTFICRDPNILTKISKSVNFSGSVSASENVRIMFTADMFNALDGMSAETVVNGIVTRAVSAWIAERENVRQVDFLKYLAQQLTNWTYFVDTDAKNADPLRVLDAITAAHEVIVGHERAAQAKEWDIDGSDLPEAFASQLDEGRKVEDVEYREALNLRDSLVSTMEHALGTSTMLVLPILAGAPPKLKPGKKLSKQAAAVAKLSCKYAAFVAMAGFPAAVVPVPAPAGGAPWAVLFLGRHRCEQQLVYVAVKISAYVVKMAESLPRDSDKGKASQDAAPSNSSKPANGHAKASKPNADEAKAQSELFKSQGNDAFKQGNYVESISMYTRALQMDPRNAILYSNRAMAYLKLEQYDHVINDCDQSLKLNWSVKAVFRRATAYTALGRWQDALKDFKAVLKHEPNNKQAAHEVAHCKDMIAAVEQNVDEHMSAAPEDMMLS